MIKNKLDFFIIQNNDDTIKIQFKNILSYHIHEIQFKQISICTNIADYRYIHIRNTSKINDYQIDKEFDNLINKIKNTINYSKHVIINLNNNFEIRR